jgi:hypothetical protein
VGIKTLPVPDKGSPPEIEACSPSIYKGFAHLLKMLRGPAATGRTPQVEDQGGGGVLQVCQLALDQPAVQAVKNGSWTCVYPRGHGSPQFPEGAPLVKRRKWGRKWPQPRSSIPPGSQLTPNLDLPIYLEEQRHRPASCRGRQPSSQPQVGS